MCQVAVATRTHPEQWQDSDPALLLTVVQVLDDRNR